MQLESLQVFCDLVRFRSFSKTAEANHVSQPTVTRVVHQLETRLGGQLIDRSRRPLELTPLGRAYYEGCKALLEQYTELELSLRQAHSEKALTVRVAAIYSVGLWDMSQCVERFEARFPQALVNIDYLHPDQVYQRVLDGTADLGLVSFPARSRELTVVSWREEDMVVACAPGHSLARLRSIRPQQLEGEKYVGFAQGLVVRRQVDRFLRDQGVTVEMVLEFDNIETIKKAVEIGAGIALLPEPTLRAELQGGTLAARPLEGCRLVRPLGIIHRGQHRLNSAAQGFLDLLRASGPGNGHEESGRVGSPHSAGGTKRGRRKGMTT